MSSVARRSRVLVGSHIDRQRGRYAVLDPQVKLGGGRDGLTADGRIEPDQMHVDRLRTHTDPISLRPANS